MKKCVSIILLALCATISGCRKQTQQTTAVVSQIAVTYEQEGALTQKVYTSSEKMRLILNALRQLGQKTSPSIDPAQATGQSYCITLTRSDGSQQIYRTKADRFILRDPGPWQQADPERIGELNQLLRSLPGDSQDTIIPNFSKNRRHPIENLSQACYT